MTGNRSALDITKVDTAYLHNLVIKYGLSQMSIL